ncbi:MAG: hypothetical protein IIC51_06590 [Planctomycetes bacterium]|nr:hypothetical protein [Planctomycetota bacterium]
MMQLIYRQKILTASVLIGIGVCPIARTALADELIVIRSGDSSLRDQDDRSGTALDDLLADGNSNASRAGELCNSVNDCPPLEQNIIDACGIYTCDGGTCVLGSTCNVLEMCDGAASCDQIIFFDANLTYLAGPENEPFNTPFTLSDFESARMGQAPQLSIYFNDGSCNGIIPEDLAAAIVSTSVFVLDIPNSSALYAIDFEVTGPTIENASIDLFIRPNDTLGGGPNQGVYINGMPLSGDTTGGTCGVGSPLMNIYRTDIGSLLHVGTNTLYLNITHTGGDSGLLLSAEIRVDTDGPHLVHVDDDAPPGGDGTTWDTAYRFLQDALADASGGGVTETRVGQGTYKPDRDEANPKGTGIREARFQLVSGVALLGGFAGIGAPDPDERDIVLYETVLSGDLAGNDGPNFQNYDENSYSVVRGSALSEETRLDGFVIRGGNATGNEFEFQRGGGLRLDNDDIGLFVLADCVFAENRGVGAGGAYLRDVTASVSGCTFVGNEAVVDNVGGLEALNIELSITDCVFANNFSASRCGGMWLSGIPTETLIENCLFDSNEALETGGGLYCLSPSATRPVTVRNCEFRNNVITPLGPGTGGGLHAVGEVINLIDCLFVGNSSAIHGGGAYMSTNDISTVVNCTFLGNTAGYDGGGLQLLGGSPKTIVNSLFLGNVAFRDGGGIFNPVSGGGDAGRRFANCTVAGNTAGGVGGGILAGDTDNVIENCVVWGNSDINGQGQESQVTFSNWPFPVNYSCIQGWNGTYDGVGSHGNDPLFIDPDNGDYRLSSGSPCIDAADNSAVPKGIDTDLDGNLRFVDDPDTKDTGFGDPPIVDMGAYEFQVVSSCPWDLDDDGDVGVKDLLILLGAWGPCKGCPADFDDSGDVGVKDLLILLGAWGPCP